MSTPLGVRRKTMVIAIDPGPVKSALVEWDGSILGLTTHSDNSSILAILQCANASDCLAIEMIASYGMAVGAEVFETCVVIGKFEQAFRGGHVCRVPRLKIKQHLCHNTRANDSAIRQAIIDRFGGKDMAIGRKHSPGPLYGLKADLWAAFAVALWYHDTGGK